MILARFVLDMLWKAVYFMCCIICGFFLLQTRILGRERAAGSLLWAKRQVSFAVQQTSSPLHMANIKPS